MFEHCDKGTLFDLVAKKGKVYFILESKKFLGRLSEEIVRIYAA